MANSSTAFVKKENKFKEEGAQLPSGYGRTEAFLLPQDPRRLFLFWEITGRTYDYIKSEYGQDVFERSRSVIRLHDVTHVIFDGYNSNSYADMSVYLGAPGWYIETPAPNRVYVADLGLVTPEGKFILLARSNACGAAPGKISDNTDQKWMVVERDFQKLLEMSGAKYIGMGASELSHMLNEKWQTILGQGLSSNMPSSLPADAAEEAENIWLRAECEIIIRGAASQNAKLFVDGKEVTDKDNTFYIRKSLSEGETLELPVAAEKGALKRALKIKAERED